MRTAIVKLPKLYSDPADPGEELDPLAYPYADEMAYKKALLEVVRGAADMIYEEVGVYVPGLVAAADQTMPRTDSIDDDMRAMFDSLEKKFQLFKPKAQRLAAKMLDKVNRDQAKAFGKAFAKVLPVSPRLGREPWLMDAFGIAVQQNVELIQALPRDMALKAQHIVAEGLLTNRAVSDIETALKDQVGIAEDRARLIAEDQVGKWHGSLNQLRQMDAGITEYIWSTQLDERVRPWHLKLEGKKCNWNKPPIVAANGRRAHPGGDIRCRCSAAPVAPGTPAEGED